MDSSNTANRSVPSGSTFEDLMGVVKTLRDPGGCPWDQEQTHSSLRKYLLEETYETLEAIEVGDPVKLKEELGDLLTHIAFHADMAQRAGEWDSIQLFRSLIEKLVRRHPHVFGEERMATAKEVEGQWERIKRREGGRDSLLGGIPDALPALAQAAAIQRRALKAGLAQGGAGDYSPSDGAGIEQLEREAGEYLWGVVVRIQLAGVDPETALRAAVLRFKSRIRLAEQIAGGRPIAELEPDERQRIWEQALV